MTVNLLFPYEGCKRLTKLGIAQDGFEFEFL